MLTRDLMNIKELKELKLLAGEKGLSRAIRWIYFADSLECTNKEDDPQDWIHSGELIVVTNNKMLENPEIINSLIRKAHEKQSAGFIINIDKKQQSYLDLCNSLNMPLFEIPWTVKLVDLSQCICTRIIQEAQIQQSMEHLLDSIICSNYETSQTLIDRASFLGIDLNQNCRIAVFRTAFARKQDNAKEDNYDSDHGEYIAAMIRHVYHGITKKNLLTQVRGNDIAVLYADKEIGKTAFSVMIEQIRANIADRYNGMTIRTGIGNPYANVSQFKKSYQEALKAVNLIDTVGNEKSTLYFKDTGMYSLFFLIQDQHELSKFCDAQLAPLTEYDKMNNTDLCYTLEKYLQHNKNTGIAAEALFIHRNTMRYRLEKIQNILELDLDNLDQIVTISTALHVRRYLDA
jgi:sugar diacid utilization regulator